MALFGRIGRPTRRARVVVRRGSSLVRMKDDWPGWVALAAGCMGPEVVLVAAAATAQTMQESHRGAFVVIGFLVAGCAARGAEQLLAAEYAADGPAGVALDVVGWWPAALVVTLLVAVPHALLALAALRRHHRTPVIAAVASWQAAVVLAVSVVTLGTSSAQAFFGILAIGTGMLALHALTSRPAPPRLTPGRVRR